MMLCDWHDYDTRLGALLAMVRAGGKASVPFPLLALPASPAIRRAAAEIYAAAKHPPSPHPLWHGERYAHDRICIGYFSADLRNHPVALLTAEMFERHDRSRFEVTAFSLGPKVEDAMGTRLRKAFEHFLDLGGESDRAIAQEARRREIDIAIDLQGFTRDNRTNIFAQRCAPIQVNYLGFPGTMGAPYMDYILADAVVIPAGQETAYAEKIVRLPHSYLPHDSMRPIAPTVPSRAEAALPPDGFVFCCFNNSYKITPDLFAIWMRLLGKVSGSVLWLREDDNAVRRNLLRAAQGHGIAPDRLVFAPRVPELADHLARYLRADLFLDTLYYNAHTTASDALWAGLPVLTCLGDSFAGRVAASLLLAVGLPELVTRSAAEYEAAALRLAADPAALSVLKAKLVGHRATAPLFDCALYTRHIEAAYRTMWERFRRGEKPDHIAVAIP